VSRRITALRPRPKPIPQAAQTAARLMGFQRTPNYVIPARNGPIDDNQRRAIKADYPAIWEMVSEQIFGFPMDSPGRDFADVDEAECRRVLERNWEIGGFRFLFEMFDDLLDEQHANDVGSEFVRDRIRSIVRDPGTAEMLCPKNHPLGSKRPPLGHHYYETFNRKNVSLVDVSENSIEAVTENGPRLADGAAYEFDMIVLATGFDVATGSLTAIDVCGSDGRSIKEIWCDGPLTHLGVPVSGFPNLFMVGGPGFPFGNFPMAMDFQTAWIADLIDHAREGRRGHGRDRRGDHGGLPDFLDAAPPGLNTVRTARIGLGSVRPVRAPDSTPRCSPCTALTRGNDGETTP
jgi:cyclohexanone monooxygenase